MTCGTEFGGDGGNRLFLIRTTRARAASVLSDAGAAREQHSRYRCNQPLRVFMLRIGEDCSVKPTLRSRLCGEWRCGRKSGHRSKIMRNIENGHSCGAVQFAKQRQNFRLRNYMRALVASSAISSAGRCIIAIAISTRCACPTLICAGCLPETHHLPGAKRCAGDSGLRWCTPRSCPIGVPAMLPSTGF